MITGRTYNISELYSLVFGHVALPYPAGEEPALPDPAGTLQAVAGSQRPARGLRLGTPQFMPLSIEDEILAIEPLVSLEGMARINRTPINGGRKKGTVKEMYAFDDYRIRIQGFVESDDYTFPSDELGDIRRYFTAGRTLKVDCELLRVWGVQYMVIERVRNPEMQGVQHLQAFELTGYSDDYPERELTLEDN